MNVAILAFETFASLPIVGPMDILNKSCELLRDAHGHFERAGLTVTRQREDVHSTTFDIELVALTKRPLRFGAVTLHPHASIVSAKKPELIIIPSLGDNVVESLSSLRAFLPWIKVCSAQGCRVVSLCTGAFLLAESGLLDGRTATTHWFFAELFRKRYPKVNLRPERLIVDEGSVITAGAATSFLDLILYLIELYCGRDAAILTAKILLIEMGRYTQLPYTIFSTRKMHGDLQILRVQQLMEVNGQPALTVEGLAERAGMSLRNFDRRFRNAVGEVPSAYLQQLRIEKAKRLLEATNDTIAEIITKVGYEDERSFRRLFRALTDLSPGAYRQRYGARGAQIAAQARRSFGHLLADA